MFVLVGVLTLFGLVAIWSAEGAQTITAGSGTVRQAVYAVLGFAAMFTLASINYRFLKSFAIPIYVLMLAMLASLAVIGTTIGGSTRWIIVGPISFQPSEFAKLGIIIALAAFLSEKHQEMKQLRYFLLSGIIVGLPLLLVYWQPDLGTSIVFAVIWLAMLAVSRTRLLYLFGLLLLMIPFSLIAWRYLLLDYQKERLLISFDPQRDYFGQGFNIVQAQVSIGTAGWFGHGLSGGLQSEYQFLRVRETDFIFAHAVSMFGMLGGIALFLVFIMLFHRMTRTVYVARDTFGQYVAVGIIAMIGFQTFVNIGMNLGLMPVTGIPLPFVSLGGTSLMVNLAAIGILQSIILNRQRLAFQAKAVSERRI